MVRKGVGWLLKDTYRAKPKETASFISSVDPPFAKLVIRIVGELARK
jgi:hypothetical protein